MEAVYIAVIILVLVIVGFILYSQSTKTKKSNNFSPEPSLSDKGWIVYMRPGCGWCDKQKNTLAESGLNYQYVACGQLGQVPNGELISAPSSKPCESVRGFPLWYNRLTKEEKPGYLDLAKVKAL
jgi:hypothetical protein